MSKRTSDEDDPGRAARVVVQRLESLRRAGVGQLPRANRPPPTVAASSAGRRGAAAMTAAAKVEAAKVEAAAGPLFPAAEDDRPASTVDERREALRVLQEEVVACCRCAELAATRTQTVFGVGNPQARLCFLGEAPGADEDRQGEPFVGRAGQLLTRIIEACTLRREDVYIMNVLKCRPPGNRNPSVDEAANCRGFFERQLEIIRPQFICCLGAIAAGNLLETSRPIGQLRGRFHTWRGMQVIATYHPAYLLRNPDAKRYVWDDMKLLMQAMGVPLPAPPAGK